MNNQLDTSTKALREFACTMAAALAIIFCLFLPWLFHRTIPMWPLLAAAILLLQAITYPPSLIPVQQLWMRIGAILGWINTRVILAVVFFVLITPLGYLQRKRGKLNYIEGFDPQVKTYKISRSQRLTAKDLENPF
jgi:cell division protein FtsW (lipid II flippase)